MFRIYETPELSADLAKAVQGNDIFAEAVKNLQQDFLREATDETVVGVIELCR
jgi:hypothetical protein